MNMLKVIKDSSSSSARTREHN